MPTYVNLSKDPGAPRFEKMMGDILAEVKPGGAIKILSPDESISEQQNKWLHCKDGPVRMLIKAKNMGFVEAKVYLKTEFGKHWFVKDINPANVNSCTDAIYWYCNVTACEKKAFHVLQANQEGNIYVCPECGSSDIKLIAVKSINKKAVSIIRLWFDEIIRHFQGKLPDPDPRWRERENDNEQS